MKKIFLLCMLVILVTGCTNIENSSLDEIVNNAISSKVETKNVNRTGYSYYLSKGMSISNNKIFNEVLKTQKYQYYLYVDVVSYNSKILFDYTINNGAFYSKNIEYNGKKGYIEINNYKNDQYLIEIMYNYAKIEVMVYETDIKNSVTYAMAILSSIAYNDNVVEKYLASSVLDTVEEEFDIFEIVGSDNYLQFTEDVDSTEEVRDPDYIN